MQKKKKIVSAILIFAMLFSCTAGFMGQGTAAEAASARKKTKAYILSKKAGTYTGTTKVKLTARKGYKVYYTTNGTFSKNKLLKAGKSKKFTVKKTTTLYVYAVKKTKKITSAKLKKKAIRKAAAKYVYKIKKTTTVDTAVSTTASPDATATATADATATPTASPGKSTPPSPPSGERPGNPGENTGGNTGQTGATGNPASAQEDIDTAAAELPTVDLPSATKEPVEYSETATPTLTLQKDGVLTENFKENSTTYSVEEIDNSPVGARKVLIQKAGTYILTGGTSEEPIENTVIEIAKSISGTVNLVLDSLQIDNSAMGTVSDEDSPCIAVGKGTTDVTVTLIGASSLTGNGYYTSEPASGIIYAKDGDSVLTFMASENDSDASLTVVDGMSEDTEYSDYDATDGIFAKGTLLIQSGVYTVTSNGDCLKATGSDGAGGVALCGGTYQLNSRLSNGIRSKNGNIVISDGTIQIEHTAADGINAKNYWVSVSGGSIKIDNCYEDGIQAENVLISGDDTTIDIVTRYAYAGKNFYNTALGSGNYNTLSSTDSVKVENISADTGSHKAIKAGTKACTYEYASVAEDSDYTAGTTYTTEASGGLYITGGTLNLDTTNVGIKYNGSNSGSGNLSPADNEGTHIIGSPDDTIHSNNICVISGGTITLASSDDAITGVSNAIIMNDTTIHIETCYEGIEAGEIRIGSQSDSDSEPQITIYSNDDGINAASKSSVHYAYADESEEVYTKTQTSSGDNDFYLLSGYIGIMIGDDQSHSFSLPFEGEENTAGTYSSDGDGIDCNGSFFAYGGTVIVFGSSSGANSPIDTDSAYYIGEGVTLLAAGSNEMNENPTSTEQACITYGGSSSSGPGRGPGQLRQGSSSSITSGGILAVQDESGNTILTLKAPKTLSYLLYSSPELTAGNTYSFYLGGSCTGSLVIKDWEYDCRYTEYGREGASLLATVTAGTN